MESENGIARRGIKKISKLAQLNTEDSVRLSHLTIINSYNNILLVNVMVNQESELILSGNTSFVKKKTMDLFYY